jgi:hypothetical protein
VRCSEVWAAAAAVSSRSSKQRRSSPRMVDGTIKPPDELSQVELCRVDLSKLGEEL